MKDIGWIEASQLTSGNVLCLQDGKNTVVTGTSCKYYDIPVTVYNFEVKDWHTYFVGVESIFVHNANCNWNSISDSYLKSKGLDAHAIKYEYLGKKANIKLYDLYYDKNTGAISIFLRKTKQLVEVTTYFIK